MCQSLRRMIRNSDWHCNGNCEDCVCQSLRRMIRNTEGATRAGGFFFGVNPLEEWYVTLITDIRHLAVIECQSLRRMIRNFFIHVIWVLVFIRCQSLRRMIRNLRISTSLRKCGQGVNPLEEWYVTLDKFEQWKSAQSVNPLEEWYVTIVFSTLCYKWHIL